MAPENCHAEPCLRAFAFFRVLFPDTLANSPNSFEPLLKPRLEWPSGTPYVKRQAPCPILQSIRPMPFPPPPHSTYYFKILCVYAFYLLSVFSLPSPTECKLHESNILSFGSSLYLLTVTQVLYKHLLTEWKPRNQYVVLGMGKPTVSTVTEIKEYFNRFNTFRQGPWGIEVIQSRESRNHSR